MIARRIGTTLEKALNSGLNQEMVQLDCYNNSVVATGISVTVTTRINACNHYWILEIDD